MSETTDTETAVEPEAQLPYLIGVRLRAPLQAEDHLTDQEDLAVGEFVIVETGQGTAVGEIRRPKRPLPEFKRGRLYRQVMRRATHPEVAEWRERHARELQHAETCRRRARGRGLRLKVVDVEIDPGQRRVTVLFNAEERVDFRDLVRDLAHEFHARIEMRQIGARDTTKLMDGIGPCGRQLCCTSYLKKFDPISVKMAKTQDMPLTDSRLLGNCGRLKCCLLYEFSTYDQLRKHLPKVGSACQADCGTQGCMTGKVRSLRVLKQTVVVGFQDGTEAEVPLEALTWEGRPHVHPL
jgi:cell fate regulator YaaT (PSP1 superfamily)